jgi:hypothetical protein
VLRHAPTKFTTLGPLLFGCLGVFLTKLKDSSVWAVVTLGVTANFSLAVILLVCSLILKVEDPWVATAGIGLRTFWHVALS